MGPKGELKEVKHDESDRKEVSINDWREQLKQVDTMKYLGVMISGDGSLQREVETKIGCASRVIGGMSQAGSSFLRKRRS